VAAAVTIGRRNMSPITLGECQPGDLVVIDDLEMMVTGAGPNSTMWCRSTDGHGDAIGEVRPMCKTLRIEVVSLRI